MTSQAATGKQSGNELCLGPDVTAAVVIDTPPSVAETIAGVIEVCDLVEIPVRPSPNDLRAVGGTIELARRAQADGVRRQSGHATRQYHRRGRDRAQPARNRAPGSFVPILHTSFRILAA